MVDLLVHQNSELLKTQETNLQCQKFGKSSQRVREDFLYLIPFDVPKNSKSDDL